MQFKGREMAYREAGMEKFKAILARLVDIGAVVDETPKMMGNRIIAIVTGDKKKLKPLT